MILDGIWDNWSVAPTAPNKPPRTLGTRAEHISSMASRHTGALTATEDNRESASAEEVFPAAS